MIGGAVFALGEMLIALLFPESLPLSQRFAGIGLSVIEAAEFVALILLLLGLVGLCLHQSRAAGVFLFVSFVLAFVGTAWSAGEVWTSAFLFSSLSSAVPQYLDSLITAPPPLVAVGVGMGFILYPLGWILFSAASARAGVFSRWACGLVIAGVLLIPFLPLLANALFGVGLVWMGYRVWSAPLRD